MLNIIIHFNERSGFLLSCPSAGQATGYLFSLIFFFSRVETRETFIWRDCQVWAPRVKGPLFETLHLDKRVKKDWIYTIKKLIEILNTLGVKEVVYIENCWISNERKLMIRHNRGEMIRTLHLGSSRAGLQHFSCMRLTS